MKLKVLQSYDHQAFAWLDCAYNERSSMLTLYLTNDPRMDSLRFGELVRRIGLPQ